MFSNKTAGASGLGMANGFGQRAHFEIPVDARNPQEFAGAFGAVEEFAQVGMRAVVLVEFRGFFRDGGTHASTEATRSARRELKSLPTMV